MEKFLIIYAVLITVFTFAAIIWVYKTKRLNEDLEIENEEVKQIANEQEKQLLTYDSVLQDYIEKEQSKKDYVRRVKGRITIFNTKALEEE